jgi:hypothetical protein
MRWVDFMALKQSIGIEQMLEHYGVRPQARAQRFAWPLCAPHPWFRSQPGKLCSADHIWACHSASCRGAQGQMGGTILDLVACMATCTIREAGRGCSRGRARRRSERRINWFQQETGRAQGGRPV